MGNSDVLKEVDVWTALKDTLRTELERYRRELTEVVLMLEQSQVEVEKLTQRNASITTHVQQIQSQFDTMPRADIRMAYDSALDAQQRLFVMRGQAEKLKSDKAHLERYVSLIEQVLKTYEGGSPTHLAERSASETAESVEMIIQAQESERQRLSRQMHDGPAQALSNFILQTEIAMRLFDIEQDKAKEELDNLKLSATDTFRKVRDFIFELRPMILDDLGLVPTLKRYQESLKDQTGLEIRLTFTGPERRLQSYQEVMIFRAIQELLNNACDHSQASSIKIQLDMGESDIRVLVEDDGKGFDVTDDGLKSGMGLKAIRDRVEKLGGSMDVDSVIGQGTRVTLQMPAAALVVE